LEGLAAPAADSQQVESPQPAPEPSPATETERPSPRRELASLDEALRQQPGGPSGRPSARTNGRAQASGSDRRGDSGPDPSTSSSSSSEAGPPHDRADASSQGDSGLDPSTPQDEQAGGTGEGEGEGGGSPSSRRGRAEARDLRAERDAIAAERDQLKQALEVSPELYQAAIASRLPDDEFVRLATKKQKEDLTGDYLTPAESDQLTRAIQIREWSLPWYLDAQKKVHTWTEQEWAGIQQRQADAIAATMKARPYLKPEPVAKAGSWQDITTYFCDASFEAGASSRQAEIDDLKSELEDERAGNAGRRTAAASRGRVLERGGVSGGAYRGAAPAFGTSSASDLLDAAFKRQAEAERRQRRTG